MRKHSFYLLAGALGLLALAAPQPTSGQGAARPTVAAEAEVSPALAALIDQLAEQNKQLAANQAQIDEKIDALAETIRQARIFAARSGKGAK